MSGREVDADAYDVHDYLSGASLPGFPSAELVKESLAAGDTGAVNACYDGEHWQFIDASQVSLVRDQGNSTRVVYVLRAGGDE